MDSVEHHCHTLLFTTLNPSKQAIFKSSRRATERAGNLKARRSTVDHTPVAGRIHTVLPAARHTTLPLYTAATVPQPSVCPSSPTDSTRAEQARTQTRERQLVLLRLEGWNRHIAVYTLSTLLSAPSIYQQSTLLFPLAIPVHLQTPVQAFVQAATLFEQRSTAESVKDSKLLHSAPW